MAAHGRTIALWSAGLGVLVLLGGAVILRERLAEEWHIHKLQTGSPEEARRAAEALGRMGAVRAVPALLAAPGRLRKDLPAGGRRLAGRFVSVHQLPEIIGSDLRLRATLPFPAVGGFDWQDAFKVAILGPSAESDIIVDARVGSAWCLASIWVEGAKAALDAFLWASAAIAAMGERAVPALERAASDQSLDAGARAFGSFELARRALENPGILLQDGSAKVTLEQRTSEPLPGSRGSVYLSAGDVTRGRVKVWVTASTGKALVQEHPLAEGEEIPFSLGGKGYVLRLEDLRNRLIGTDSAVFELREDRPE